MKPKLITSRELLAAAGISNEPGTKIPREHRHLLITSVLEPVAAHKLREILVNHGYEVSLRDISTWLQATREWLGLPSAGRGKPSMEYRKTVEKWRYANGNPTLEEIDAGWVPIRRSPRKGHPNPNLSLAVNKRIEDFLQMLTSFDEAENDEEVKQRLAGLLDELKMASSEIEDQGRAKEVPPSPDPNPTDDVPPSLGLDRMDEALHPQDLDQTAEVPPPQDLERTEEVPPPQDLDRKDEISPSPDPAPDGTTPST